MDSGDFFEYPLKIIFNNKNSRGKDYYYGIGNILYLGGRNYKEME